MRMDSLSIEEYHQRPEVSRSMAHVYDSEEDGPEVYFGRFVAETIPPPSITPAMEFGNLVDAYLTEQTAPSLNPPANVVVAPEESLSANGRRQGAAWKQFEADHSGSEIWTPAEYDKYLQRQREKRDALDAIEAQIQSHSVALGICNNPDIQWQPTWIDSASGWRCRPDFLIPGLCLGDIKTSARISERAFMSAVQSYSYDMQAGLARHACAMEYGHPLPFLFIVIKSTAPYTVEVFQIPADWCDYGAARFFRALEGIKSKQWRSGTHCTIRQLTMPRYLNRLEGLDYDW